MTTTSGLRLINADDLSAALEDHLARAIGTLLSGRAAGHCVRCDDLDVDLAVRVCRRLRSATTAQIYVLGTSPPVAQDVAASSTKIVELRNPDEADEQRPVLLVFVPPGTRASAEDSFGVATFEQLALGPVYDRLAAELLDMAPDELADRVRELFAALRDERWAVADGRARCRYLLTVAANDHDYAAAGAAVCELGLIPDPQLIGTAVTPRAMRNVRTVRSLHASLKPDRQRILALGLTDPEFRRRAADFAATVGLADPLRWTRAIVADREYWSLFFEHWTLQEDTHYEEIGIEVDGLDLPLAGDAAQDERSPVLRGITGQHYLPTGTGGIRELPVGFRLDRDPRQVAGLTRFRVQLMAEHAGEDDTTTVGTPTEVAAVVAVGKTNRSTYRARLRKLTQAALEEGWHYVRVLGLDTDGLPVAQAGPTGGSRPANESERFYVLPDGAHDGAPPSRKPQPAAGVTQAARRLEFATAAAGGSPVCTPRAVRWQDPPRGSGGAPHVVVADFGPDGLVDVTLSRALAVAELGLLAEPETATHWHLPVSVTQGTADTAVAQPSRWTEHADPDRRDAFLAARTELFDAIATAGGRVSDQNISKMPVEACDLAELRDPVVAYVEAHRALLDAALATAERTTDESAGPIDALADLARIDTVTVTLTDHRGSTHEIVLVAPTHPQRLLWLTAWATLGRQWAAAPGDAATIAAAGRALQRLRPLGSPLVVPRSGRRLAVASTDLGPYWGVCLPDGTADPQGLIALLESALDVPGYATITDAWSGAALAERLELYLRRHPYVTHLVLNAVNVGRGDEIAAAIERLRAGHERTDVALEVRLYVGDPAAPGSGTAVAALLDGPDPTPSLSVTVADRDEFVGSGGDTAHLTVLFDALSTERLGVSAAGTDRDRPLPVHGLVAQMDVRYRDEPDGTTWRKRPRLGRAAELAGAEELTDLLSTVPTSMASAAVTVAVGQSAGDRVPEVSLTLSAADSGLLDHAHRCSDWVITVDRTLGVEFFDGPRAGQRPDHVIDYAPETTNSLGHQLVVSSRALDELCAMLVPILSENGLSVADRHVATFFDQLRLLSGRLALKLASVTPTQRTEVLGLALARLALEHDGTLADHVLVPLDAHPGLYAQARADGAEPDLRRTDLALFKLDPDTRTITCRLIEVKCSTAGLGVGGYQSLKQTIRAQVERTESVLAAHYDPGLGQRPHRVTKNLEFANLLGFYLGRSRRHHVVSPAMAEAGHRLLDSLDDGYRLEFERSGLVFDLGRNGRDTETENAVQYVLVGRDHVQALLDAVPTGPLGPDVNRGDPDNAEGGPEPTADRPDGSGFDPGPPTSDHGATAEPPAQSSSPGTDEDAPEPGPEDPNDRPDQPATEPAAEPVGSGSEPPAGNGHGGATEPDVFVGTSGPSPQFTVLGEAAPQATVALDLDETHTISLFGVQGGGKSYTLGSLIEGASLSVPGLNRLSNPLATIVFHYSATQDYAPEFTSMIEANDDDAAIARLRERFGVEPKALNDVVLLAPRDQCDRRRAEYPGLRIEPLVFGSAELAASHWRFLMGAVGNQATYVRQLNRIMRAHRDGMSLETLRSAVEESGMADHIKTLAQHRLDMAGDYIDDNARIGDLVTPGRLLIVDLRDELIEKDEALGLFVVLMQLFADARGTTERFNKLVVFDEAHKYIDSPELVKGLVENVREMRHKGMSVLVASQDPPSVPIPLIELSDHIIVHKFTSPAWLRHLQKANAALSTVTSERLAELRPGEAYLWAGKSTDAAFTERMVRIRTRPRITRHGGATRRATDL